MGDEDGVEAVMATKLEALRLKEEKRKQKDARMQMMIEVATRKALQDARQLENRGKKRAREKQTLRSFWEAPGRGQIAASEPIQLEDHEVGNGALDLLAIGTLNIGEAVAVTAISSDSSPNVHSEDDPNFFDPKGGVGYSSEEELDVRIIEEEDMLVPSAKKRRGSAIKNYDLTRKYQLEWAAKLPWSEGVLAQDGIIHQVKCKSCSDVGRQPLLMQPRWHTLEKHDRCEKHKKNMFLFVAKRPTTVLEQVNKCNTVEARRKRVQFATLFQCLKEGRSMLEFENRLQLYKLLRVPDLPNMHWSDTSGWIMAEHMYSFMKLKMKSLLASATFIALTADETSAKDNTSWIAIHCYVLVDWERLPLLINLQKLESDGATADSLTAVLTTTLKVHAGLPPAEIASKLVCFGADGVSAFQGQKNGVTKQLKDGWAPFSFGQHCLAHRLNLAYKILSDMGVFHAAEELLRVAYAYFAHSPKKQTEFHELALLMKTKGLKMLKNVKTRWVSVISPLRRVIAEYRSLMAKMHADSDQKKWGTKAKVVMAHMKDPYTLLGMLAMLPLLETIDALMKWAQQQNVYVCDFVSALHKTKGKLFEYYLDRESAFIGSEFYAFKQLLICNHEQIYLAFQHDMNKPECELAFLVDKEVIFAEHDGKRITRSSYAELGDIVKAECKEAAQSLLEELNIRFPSSELMEALGIVYPQYWIENEQPATFRMHLEVIKLQYGASKWVGQGDKKTQISPILNSNLLESQQPLFKLAMFSNAVAACALPTVLTGPGSVMINPLTKIWRTLESNSTLSSNFSEYVKLAKLAMTHVLGSVEDERCFSSLSFLKDKLRNRLDGHLSMVVGMHGQNVYTLDNFPYDDCFKEWVHSAERGRYGLHGID